MSYSYRLPSTSSEGTINGIKIRWSQSSYERLGDVFGDAEHLYDTAKALTENFFYLLAFRLQKTTVTITGQPHEVTVDSATGQESPDDLHISGRLQGNMMAHIYLDGQGGQGEDDRFDHITVKGESVVTKQSKPNRDPNLSRGTFPSSLNATRGGTTATPTTSAAYTVASTSDRQSAATTHGEWEWIAKYSRFGRRDPNTGEWEWAPETGATEASTKVSTSASGSGSRGYAEPEYDEERGCWRRYNWDTNKWEWA